MSPTDAWTIGRLITWTTDYLKEQGSDSARLDAEVLLANSLQCQRIDLYTSFEQDPGQSARNKFRALVKQRAAGTPVAYLVGEREFFSLSFQVTPDVLIPRPETEFLVMAALDTIREYYAEQATITLADVGTGSGAIAVSIASQLANCQIRALDSSSSALQIAQQNIEQHQVESRVSTQQSDLFEQIQAAEKYHIVISNPPYISQEEYEQLAPSVREFEPQSALLAGPTGLEIYDRLIPQAAAHLHPQGWLIVETSPRLHPQVISQLQSSCDYETVRGINDLAGLPRVITARYNGNHQQQTG
ncbi:MAG TPA: peptide chain release factor N(5)-glutamine methyltransferase [Planctomycetaceae bacterium]|nr:peptide chain release factor N(5)-glutamine methyltransferase [Planctomycetaceae bacterium]